MTARPVYVRGVGMTQFTFHRTSTVEQLGQDAVRTAVDDSGLAPAAIGEVFCGTVLSPSGTGQRVLRDLGLTGPPVTNVENACSSGASAFRLAVRAVACGAVDTALAFGVEHLSSLGPGTLPLPKDLEATIGLTPPALYALRARAYFEATGADAKHLAMVSVKARRHGALNPYAHLRETVTLDDVLGARMIADPLTRLMCCPASDGAAAAVVSAEPGPGEPITVAASVLCSGIEEDQGRDMAWSETTARAAAEAYATSGLGPADVDLAEIHDAFAINELMYYEALGFCDRGGAASLLESEQTSLGGRIPVNPSGGLLCRGHPAGATGVAQICEAVWQLRGTARHRQVEGARVALTHTTGGGVSGLDHVACAIHLLRKERS
ncbi:MAG TPA: thiolase family protein [Acidimicrobiia bacterium]|nr:thiolase family protein [Acidimicrobiia bacterium]